MVQRNPASRTIMSMPLQAPFRELAMGNAAVDESRRVQGQLAQAVVMREPRAIEADKHQQKVIASPSNDEEARGSRGNLAMRLPLHLVIFRM